MPQKSTIKPSIGRIVIFVLPEEKVKENNNATEAPAVIVRTWENTGYENDECNLKVFTDGENNLWASSVPYSEANEPNSWHWPPRV